MRRNAIWITGIITSLLLGSVIAWAGSDNGLLVFGLPLFALCCLLAFTIQWVIFIPAFVYQTERYFDLTGSLTYITLSLVAVGIEGIIEEFSGGLGACRGW